MAREKWGSRATFILAAIGSAVGLGNAWRFPAQAAKWGGGTFLIAYIVALFILGFPLLMMELTLGRRTQKGAPGAFRGLGKKLEPVGWMSTFTAFGIVTYYAVVVAWVLVMIVGCFWLPQMGGAEGAYGFFNDQILHITSGPTDFGNGGFAWWVIIGLAVAWIAIWFCIRKGVHSVGKVVKYTVFIPVVLLIALAIYGATLVGAGKGILIYLTPVGAKFLDPQMWLAAFSQVFYSLSIMMSIMIAYSSFLKRDTNLVKDTALVVLSDAVISIIAGFVIFATLGYMANNGYNAYLADGTVSSIFEKGLAAAPANGVAYSYEEFFNAIATTGGPSLTFSLYAAVIATLPGGAAVQIIIGIVFYVTLFTLAIDSAFSIVEGVSTAISDKFRINKNKTTLWTCVVAAVVSLLYATTAGMYWLDIVDYWTNNINMAIIGVVECVTVGWIFSRVKRGDLAGMTRGQKWNAVLLGSDRFAREAALGAGFKKDNRFTRFVRACRFDRIWMFLIRYAAPIIIFVMFLFNFISIVQAPYGGYSQTALILGGWLPTVLIFVASFVLPFVTKRSKRCARIRVAEEAELSWEEMDEIDPLLHPELAPAADSVTEVYTDDTGDNDAPPPPAAPTEAVFYEDEEPPAPPKETK